MPKLNQLKGKENLPEKIYLESTTVLEKVSVNSRNITIDQYNQLEIDIDMEKFAYVYCAEGFDKKSYPRIANFVESNLSKFLVVKKGG